MGSVSLFCVAQSELGFRLIWASRPQASPDARTDRQAPCHAPRGGAHQAEAVRERVLQGVFCRRRAPPAPAGKRCMKGVPGRARASPPSRRAVPRAIAGWQHSRLAGALAKSMLHPPPPSTHPAHLSTGAEQDGRDARSAQRLPCESRTHALPPHARPRVRSHMRRHSRSVHHPPRSHPPPPPEEAAPWTVTDGSSGASFRFTNGQTGSAAGPPSELLVIF